MFKRIIPILLFVTFVIGSEDDDTGQQNYLIQKSQFIQSYGADWTFQWTPHLTPRRIFGDKIPQSFDGRDANQSEVHVRRFIEQNIGLFRINNSDLQLWVNEQRGNIRYLIFNQVYEGVPVYNARIDFRYTMNGDLVMIGHDAFPDIEVDMMITVPVEVAMIAAQLDVDFDESKDDFIIGPPQLYIWVDRSKHPIFRLSWLVELFTHSPSRIKDEIPAHRWKIFVDANTSEVLEKIDLAAGAEISGFVTGMVKEEPYGPEYERGLPHVKVQVTGVGQTFTDKTGYYSIEIGNQNRTATVMLDGEWINTQNANGSDAVITRTVTPDSIENFHFEGINSLSGERDTYYHANVVHDFAKSIQNEFTGADYIMPANVNIGSEDPYWPCNAYWDGYSINMFSAGGGCPGTDEMADVVYHEYGHGLQQFIYEPYSPPTSSGMGEGCSDYWAMTITNSPCLGNGFFGPGSCLRDGNNSRQYPAPECGGSVHCLGEITMGSLWKMRENLIGSLGYNNAKAHADTLFFFAQVARPNTVPDFLMEILLLDDDDGYLLNGTPNYGDICDAFEFHNVNCPFEDIAIEHTPLSNTVNTTVPYVVEAVVVSIYGDIEAVTLYYSTDVDYTAVPMIPDNGLYIGEIPPQFSGTIVDYYIHAMDSEGNEIFSPEDALQTTHLFLVGEEQDFEIPFKDTFEEDQEWQVGAPGDDAITGIWIREDPNGTFVENVPVQPEDDHTIDGNIAFVTGNAPFTGDNAGDDDVDGPDHPSDGGRTTLLSPVWDLTYVSNPVLSYWKWYSNNAGASPGMDVWEVDISNDGGENWINLENTINSLNSWTHVQFKLNKYLEITSQMQVRFRASDEGEGSLVEGAIDDVTVIAMLGFNGLYGDLNADGLVAVDDIVLVVDYILGRIEFTQLQRIAADMDGDHDVDILDIIKIVNVILGNFNHTSNLDYPPTGSF